MMCNYKDDDDDNNDNNKGLFVKCSVVSPGYATEDSEENDLRCESILFDMSRSVMSRTKAASTST